MSDYIKTEKLPILEVFPVLRVQVRAEQFVGTVVEVHALLGFVENGVVEEFSVIEAEEGNVLLSFEVLVGSLGWRVVEEGVVVVGVPSDVGLVVVEAEVGIMLVFVFARGGFEVGEEAFEVLDVGFGGKCFGFAEGLGFGERVGFHRAFIHVDDNYINQPTSSFQLNTTLTQQISPPLFSLLPLPVLLFPLAPSR